MYQALFCQVPQLPITHGVPRQSDSWRENTTTQLRPFFQCMQLQVNKHQLKESLNTRFLKDLSSIIKINIF